MSALTDAVAALDLTDDLPVGELVVDAIVITRLMHQETGRETFLISVNQNISTIVQLGLINAAHTRITDPGWMRDVGDEA